MARGAGRGGTDGPGTEVRRAGPGAARAAHTAADRGTDRPGAGVREEPGRHGQHGRAGTVGAAAGAADRPGRRGLRRDGGGTARRTPRCGVHDRPLHQHGAGPGDGPAGGAGGCLPAPTAGRAGPADGPSAPGSDGDPAPRRRGRPLRHPARLRELPDRRGGGGRGRGVRGPADRRGQGLGCHPLSTDAGRARRATTGRGLRVPPRLLRAPRGGGAGRALRAPGTGRTGRPGHPLGRVGRPRPAGADRAAGRRGRGAAAGAVPHDAGGVRSTGGAYAGRGGGGGGGTEPDLCEVEQCGQSTSPSPGRVGCGTRADSGFRIAPDAGHRDDSAGDPEGGRGLSATGSGMAGRADRGDAGGCKPGGSYHHAGYDALGTARPAPTTRSRPPVFPPTPRVLLDTPETRHRLAKTTTADLTDADRRTPCSPNTLPTSSTPPAQPAAPRPSSSPNEPSSTSSPPTTPPSTNRHRKRPQASR